MKRSPKKTTVVETTTKHRLELTSVEIIEALRKDDYCIPKDADVFVTVPGGGDWSNTNLDLEDVPLVLTWSERKTENK